MHRPKEEWAFNLSAYSLFHCALAAEMYLSLNNKLFLTSYTKVYILYVRWLLRIRCFVCWVLDIIIYCVLGVKHDFQADESPMFCIIVSSSHHVHILNFMVMNDTISSDVLKYVSDIL